MAFVSGTSSTTARTSSADGARPDRRRAEPARRNSVERPDAGKPAPPKKKEKKNLFGRVLGVATDPGAALEATRQLGKAALRAGTSSVRATREAGAAVGRAAVGAAKKSGKFVVDNAGTLSAATMVAGVALSFTPLAPLGAGLLIASAGLAGIDTAKEGMKLARGDKDASWGNVGLSALGMVPGVGKGASLAIKGAKGAKHVAAATRAAGLVDETTEAVLASRSVYNIARGKGKAADYATLGTLAGGRAFGAAVNKAVARKAARQATPALGSGAGAGSSAGSNRSSSATAPSTSSPTGGSRRAAAIATAAAPAGGPRRAAAAATPATATAVSRGSTNGRTSADPDREMASFRASRETGASPAASSTRPPARPDSTRGGATHTAGSAGAPATAVGGASGPAATPDQIFADPSVREASLGVRSGVRDGRLLGPDVVEVRSHIDRRHTWEHRAAYAEGRPGEYLEGTNVTSFDSSGGIFRSGTSSAQVDRLIQRTVDEGVWLPSSKSDVGGYEVFMRFDEPIGYDSRLQFKLDADGNAVPRGNLESRSTKWMRVIVGDNGQLVTAHPVRDRTISDTLGSANTAGARAPESAGANGSRAGSPDPNREMALFGLRRTTPSLPAIEQAVAAARANPGTVTMRRSSGAVEPGWQLHTRPDGSEYATSTDAAGRTISKNVFRDDDFFRLNPQELVGANVVVRRSSGALEDGWVVAGPGRTPDTVLVSHAGAGYKELGVDRVLGAVQPARDAVTGTVSGAALRQSLEFRSAHELTGVEPIANGYIDGGRGMDIDRLGRRGSSSREVLVVDRARDVRLREHINVARNLRDLPEAARAQALARYVDEVMGGQTPDIDVRNNRATDRMRNREILIGDVPHMLDKSGVCRHRSLLFKVLADEAGLKTSIRRGNAQYGNSGGPHAWNEVRVGDETVVVDVMNPTGRAQDGAANFLSPSTSPDVRSIYHRFDGRGIYGNNTSIVGSRGGREMAVSGTPAPSGGATGASPAFARRVAEIRGGLDELDRSTRHAAAVIDSMPRTHLLGQQPGLARQALQDVDVLHADIVRTQRATEAAQHWFGTAPAAELELLPPHALERATAARQASLRARGAAQDLEDGLRAVARSDAPGSGLIRGVEDAQYEVVLRMNELRRIAGELQADLDRARRAATAARHQAPGATS